MNLRRPIRGSGKVWLAISVLLFIACWFIHGGKGGDEPFGRLWWALITGEYGSVTEMLMALSILSLAFAVPAAVVGWVLQFAVCAAVDHFHREKKGNDMP